MGRGGSNTSAAELKQASICEFEVIIEGYTVAEKPGTIKRVSYTFWVKRDWGYLFFRET